jgi:hypothetical protein
MLPPHSIHQGTEAPERLVEEDAAAGRPLIAALAISKARGGLPASGLFDCARRLSRFAGDPDGQDAWSFHAAELNAVHARWGGPRDTNNDDMMQSPVLPGFACLPGRCKPSGRGARGGSPGADHRTRAGLVSRGVAFARRQAAALSARHRPAAAEERAPAVPAYIGAAFEALPRGHRLPRLHQITVVFGRREPVGQLAPVAPAGPMRSVSAPRCTSGLPRSLPDRSSVLKERPQVEPTSFASESFNT